MKKPVFTIGLIAAGVLTASYSQADLMSEAAELGANSGAMKYCRERFATESDDGRYNTIALAAGKELDKLNDDEKTKALLMKKAAEEDGDYLGKKLDKDRCASIRKMLMVKYSVD
jgi:hypothetical protein